MTDDRNSILKLCSGCDRVEPHARRTDNPDKPRALCRGCTRGYMKNYRTESWERAKLRNTWKGMIDRCHRPDRMARWQAQSLPFGRWHDYGSAGVRVCARWRDPEHGFENFCKDVGDPPTKKHTLDRIRTRGNYTPKNVRWADKFTQDSNRKNTRWVTGPDPNDLTQTITLPMAEWARRLGLWPSTIRARYDRALKRGATTEEAAKIALHVEVGVPF